MNSVIFLVALTLQAGEFSALAVEMPSMKECAKAIPVAQARLPRSRVMCVPMLEFNQPAPKRKEFKT
jgi:hypothetical protein